MINSELERLLEDNFCKYHFFGAGRPTQTNSCRQEVNKQRCFGFKYEMLSGHRRLTTLNPKIYKLASLACARSSYKGLKSKSVIPRTGREHYFRCFARARKVDRSRQTGRPRTPRNSKDSITTDTGGNESDLEVAKIRRCARKRFEARKNHNTYLK